MSMLTMLTWNILLERLRKLHAWPYPQRRKSLMKVIQGLDPDLACFQEAGPDVLRHLAQHFQGHEYTAFNSKIPDNPESHGEYCPIFFRKDRFRLLDAGGFWLSETPDVPSLSFGWGHAQPCALTLLEDLHTGRELLVANTHLGHGKEARYRSLQLLAQRLSHDAATDILLTGDFNTLPGDEGYVPLRLSGFTKAGAAAGRHPRTLNIFGLPLASLDAVWFKGAFQELSLRVIRGRAGAVHASDHFGLLATFRMPG